MLVFTGKPLTIRPLYTLKYFYDLNQSIEPILMQVKYFLNGVTMSQIAWLCFYCVAFPHAWDLTVLELWVMVLFPDSKTCCHVLFSVTEPSPSSPLTVKS